MILLAHEKIAFELMLKSWMVLFHSEIQRGGQKLSTTCKIVSSVVWTEAIIILVVSWLHNDWLSMIQNFKLVFLMRLHLKVLPLNHNIFRLLLSQSFL